MSLSVCPEKQLAMDLHKSMKVNIDGTKLLRVEGTVHTLAKQGGWHIRGPPGGHSDLHPERPPGRRQAQVQQDVLQGPAGELEPDAGAGEAQGRRPALSATLLKLVHLDKLLALGRHQLEAAGRRHRRRHRRQFLQALVGVCQGRSPPFWSVRDFLEHRHSPAPRRRAIAIHHTLSAVG